MFTVCAGEPGDRMEKIDGMEKGHNLKRMRSCVCCRDASRNDRSTRRADLAAIVDEVGRMRREKG